MYALQNLADLRLGFVEVEVAFLLFFGAEFGICSHFRSSQLLAYHPHHLQLGSVAFVHKVVQVIQKLEPNAARVPEVMRVSLVLNN